MSLSGSISTLRLRHLSDHCDKQTPGGSRTGHVTQGAVIASGGVNYKQILSYSSPLSLCHRLHISTLSQVIPNGGMVNLVCHSEVQSLHSNYLNKHGHHQPPRLAPKLQNREYLSSHCQCHTFSAPVTHPSIQYSAVPGHRVFQQIFQKKLLNLANF